MQALRKFVAPELVMGQGAINLAGRYAVNFGAKRVLVVTDPGVQSVGWTARVVESLTAHGVQSVVFFRCIGEPSFAAGNGWCEVV